MTVLRLLVQPAELSMQDRTLPLAQPVVRPVDIVAVEPLPRHAAAIVHRARHALHLIVIRNDDSALACCHQLARLEAERACTAKGPNPASTPLCAVRMRTVFDQCKLVFRGNLTKPIEIRRMPTHMNGNNGLGARCDC